MSIIWGNWGGTSPRRARLGVEFTSVPVPSTSAVTAVVVAAREILEVQYAIQDSNNTNGWSGFAGSGSGSAPFNIPSNGTATLKTFSKSVTLNASGTTPVSLTATLTGIEYIGLSVKLSVTGSATIAAKPAPPGGGGTPTVPQALPTSNITVTKINEQTFDIGWTRVGVSANPTKSYRMEIQRDETPYAFAVAMPGVGSQPGVQRLERCQLNSRYRIRIQTLGLGAPSAWVYSPYWYTLPVAPVLKAERPTTAATVQLTAITKAAPWVTDIQWETSVNGGSWTGTTDRRISAGLVWSVAAPLTETHKYRARVKVLSVWSGWTESNLVALPAVPAAPTLISPKSVNLLRGLPTTFRWENNSLDGSAQVGAEIEWTRGTGGGATTGVITVVGSADFVTSAVPQLSETVFSWRARTKGASDVFGPWSAPAAYSVFSAPVISALTPSNGTIFNGSTVTYGWTYTDAASKPQQTVYVTGYINGEVVFTDQYNSSTASYVAREVPEGQFSFDVQVRSSAGLLSNILTRTVTVVYALPERPTIEVQWNPESYSVDVFGSAVQGLETTRVSLDTMVRTDQIALGGAVLDWYFVDGQDVQVLTSMSGKFPQVGFGFGKTGYTFRYQFSAVSEVAGKTFTVERIFSGVTTVSQTYTLTEANRVYLFEMVFTYPTGVAEGTFRMTSNSNSVRVWGWSLMGYAPGQLLTNTDPFSAASDRDGFSYGFEADGTSFEALIVTTAGDRPVLATVSMNIERTFDGRQTWQTIATGLQTSVEFRDWVPMLNASPEYRLVAISALPSRRNGDPRGVLTETLDAVFNYGPGLSRFLAFSCELDAGVTYTKHGVLHELSGRPLPSAVYDLDHEPSKIVAFKGHSLETDMQIVELVAKVLQREVVFYRDYLKRWFWADVSSVGTSDPKYGHPEMAATVTETEEARG